MNVAAYSKPVSALQSGIFIGFIGTSLRRRPSHLRRGDLICRLAETLQAGESELTFPAVSEERGMTDRQGDRPPRTIRLFGRRIPMPQSRALRVALGALLVVFGLLGFLPVLGFWMIPLGLLVISHEFAMARRYRRRTVVWWERRRKPRCRSRDDGGNGGDPA